MSTETIAAIRARWIDEDGHPFDWSCHGSAKRGDQAVKDLVTLLTLESPSPASALNVCGKHGTPNRQFWRCQECIDAVAAQVLTEAISELEIEEALRAKAAEWRERGRVMAGYSEQTRIVNARDGAAYASGRAVSLQECADELDALAATLSLGPSAQTPRPSDT